MRPARVDVVAVAASGLAALMVAGYLSIIAQQEGQPALWAVALLVLGTCAAAYGAVTRAPLRRAALGLGTAALFLVGAAAILTIGLPILLAGALSLVAALRGLGEPEA